MDLMEILKERRSIRKFTDESVPRDVINTILEAAKWAPSPSNFQGTQFIVVKSKAILKQMSDAVKDSMGKLQGALPEGDVSDYIKGYSGYFTFFEDAPAAIIVAYKIRNTFINTLTGSNMVENNHLAEISGAAAAIQNIILMAHNLGYGTCWMTGPLVAEKEFCKLLDIKSNYKIAAVLPIGKPAETPMAPDRKNISKMMKVVD